MKIETKFDIGQYVYCFDHYKPIVFRCKVCAIVIDNRGQIKYTLHDSEVKPEEALFSTPEECIQNRIDYYQRMLEEELHKKNKQDESDN